jgi:hypothetical protein
MPTAPTRTSARTELTESHSVVTGLWRGLDGSRDLSTGQQAAIRNAARQAADQLAREHPERRPRSDRRHGW